MYKKDDDLKGENTTNENEGILEYGNDYIDCKIIHDRVSTQTYCSILLCFIEK